MPKPSPKPTQQPTGLQGGGSVILIIGAGTDLDVTSLLIKNFIFTINSCVALEYILWCAEKITDIPQSANHVEFRLNVHRNSMSRNIGTTSSIWDRIVLTGTHKPHKNVTHRGYK
jgi:hypothetical protein